MNEQCAGIRERAPEVALGVISGAERARVLEHLATCAECRLYVDQLSEAADSLLLLAPEAEPPLGFESRVLGAMQQPRRSRRWLAAAAAAAILASAGTWIGLRATNGQDRATREYVATLRALGGRSLRAARLVTTDRRIAGHALLYEGTPSWIFIDLASPGATGLYEIRAHLAGGAVERIGGIRMRDGRGSWGGTITLDVDTIRAVSITDSVGSEAARAKFSSGD